MLQPIHKQTDADRVEFMELVHLNLFPKFPHNFTFPLVEDPNYKPQTTVIYVFVTALICFFITSTAVCLRLWIRYRGKFGIDDWLIIPAFVCQK